MSLADRQREQDAVEKQALYGRMGELYRRDSETPARNEPEMVFNPWEGGYEVKK